jgi:endonuclease-8
MPEGPSIVILHEAASRFAGKVVRRVEGNSKLDLARMRGRKVQAIRSWGKHFLVDFDDFSLRVHMLMFGTWRIDDPKPVPPRVSLQFGDGRLDFYSSSLKYIEGPLDESYDWRSDVLDPAWSPRLARAKLKRRPDLLVCDALLDQSVFSGVGNIIKNEVLFRIKVHPESRVGRLPPAKLGALVREARNYSFEFLEWKKRFVLRKHWLVNGKGQCPDCDRKLVRAHLGTTNRRTFYCPRCQVRY